MMIQECFISLSIYWKNKLAVWIFLTVENGQQLVEIGIANKPDLVITDYMMPELKGTEAVLKLRETYPDLRAILFTTEPDLVFGFPFPIIDKTTFDPGEFVKMVKKELGL